MRISGPYRDWAHFVFRLQGTRKERARAFLEVTRIGKPTVDRHRADIAGHNGHRHEISDLGPGEQLSVPGLLKLDGPTHLWLDEIHNNQNVWYEPEFVGAGWYITDTPFLNGLHRQPLMSGVYRIRVVMAIDDTQHLVEHESDWREFKVP